MPQRLNLWYVARLIFLVRHDDPESGRKAYYPYTLFNDSLWRAMEPNGPLSFYKPEKKVRNFIFVHEGAKAAHNTQMMCHDNTYEAGVWRRTYPFASFFMQGEHWGILGGALAIHRADFSELIEENPSEVIYVCDNDRRGEEAAAIFSGRYGRKVKVLMWGKDFPVAWDLADPIPAKMFEDGMYVGEPA